jgi:hypothetical protein
MQQIRPTKIYNLVAQSHAGASLESPKACRRLLEAIRMLGMEKETQLYQASYTCSDDELVKIGTGVDITIAEFCSRGRRNRRLRQHDHSVAECRAAQEARR